MIDFFKDAKDFIDSTSQPESVSVDYKQTKPKELKPTAPPEAPIEQKEVCKYKGLEIAEDGNTIYIGKEALEVPKWYNREMLFKRDKKTIDMVLIHHGFTYSEDKGLQDIVPLLLDKY